MGDTRVTFNCVPDEDGTIRVHVLDRWRGHRTGRVEEDRQTFQTSYASPYNAVQHVATEINGPYPVSAGHTVKRVVTDEERIGCLQREIDERRKQIALIRAGA